MSPRRASRVAMGAFPCFALVFAACGHAKLVPAPTANFEPGTSQSAAFSLADGVRCIVEADAWTGSYDAVPDIVSPVKVRILNASGKPIRLLYEDFVLVGKSGRKYHPLPVLPIESGSANAKLAPVTPIYTSWNFFVAPRVHAAYQTIQPWPKPLPRDQNFSERYYRRWGKNRPSSEMIRAALPEGVLRDGGVVTGFLYFENPVDHETRVLFEAEFDESDGPEPVATTKIPFRVE